MDDVERLLMGGSEEPNGYIRVQFDFSRASLARLEALRLYIDAPARGEVIKYALAFLEYLLKMEREDKDVHLTPDEIRQVTGYRKPPTR